MSTHTDSPAAAVLTTLDELLPDLEAFYKDIHSHPELSMHETRTAGLAADRLKAAGYEVTTGVGKTGVVGLLRNGDGPTVMLRADMDALPVKEATGLPYASTVTVTDDEWRAGAGHARLRPRHARRPGWSAPPHFSRSTATTGRARCWPSSSRARRSRRARRP